MHITKLASLGIITVLGINLVTIKKAEAIIYDVNLPIGNATAIGTIELNTLGDLTVADLNTGIWDISVSGGSVAPFTLNNGNSSWNTFSTIETGDITATVDELAFNFIMNGSFDSDSLQLGPGGPRIAFTAESDLFGLDEYREEINTVGPDGMNQEISAFNSSDGVNPTLFPVTFPAQTAAVPFEFSPTLGLLLAGGALGINKFKKRKSVL